MPKVVPEYKDLAKKKIVQAAYHIFEKKGYHASSMDDIAAEVGVSKASLYSYFNSKEDILQITINQALTEPFLKLFEDNNSVDILYEYFNNMAVFEDVLHLNFELTALSSHNENIRMNMIETYEKKRTTLSNFIKKHQVMGDIRNDIEPMILAQILLAIYTDLAMQLIIGVNEKKIIKSMNHSISTVIEGNINRDQKTLNDFF
jgi:AcrR family transcriptional regulator